MRTAAVALQLLVQLSPTRSRRHRPNVVLAAVAARAAASALSSPDSPELFRNAPCDVVAKEQPITVLLVVAAAAAVALVALKTSTTDVRSGMLRDLFRALGP
ncbi:hypothetical protein Vretimale_13935 [Volvox reticuliferus]|uniref:Uncharacterized protein n=1 Tax=Volvox reticuliferus TaxID=1737510 RepID=A0A8J4GMJ9_9CHLO|nr:hypothetical protein Vretimale_13935 [Volvox reticuliferus]